ncbi:DUF982 domain-containing protein [Rhizobium sp. C4]|uniref:DUF982 domain-containing protein n=1 Tax=Rhizobium sp. C4 TaxID=1349800 RepID=UPI001E4FA6B4|nr:DUF982 domain-containing protein [Rhizobium sp. C4]MCD2173565.1 DUF982 domain-containing protein [Rhizobium sp. C4]
MLTFDIKWIAPIRIGLFSDDAMVVEGPTQALALLHDDWPSSGGKHHQAAVHECKLACHELGRSENAREAFMAAALEAGILASAHDTANGRIRALPRKSVGDQRIALPV